MAQRRALHFVLRVGDRKETVDFYRNVLGMKVLRHEEFQEGCEAACNGPYAGYWSKTMIGYGGEDTNFVIELTYNYGIKAYKLGNDFQGFTIGSESILPKAATLGWKLALDSEGLHMLQGPGGYKFFVDERHFGNDVIKKVCLGVSSLPKSADFWHGLLGMKIADRGEDTITLKYAEDQCSLQLKQLPEQIDHASAFGRIAFSCPSDQLKDIERQVRDAGYKVLTPYVSLSTPGKATVEVVILADPDGHEICFVGDEGFRELSKVDKAADTILDRAMAEDKS